MTFDQVGELTLPQVRCLQHEGRPPRGAGRKFGSMAEAEAWRKQQREEV